MNGIEKKHEKPCAVCGKALVGYNDICPVCQWQEDFYQERHPDVGRCGNQMSFNQAKEAYKNGEPII